MLGIKQYSFAYTVPPEEAARQLRASLQNPDLSSIVAAVQPDSVKIFRKLPWWFHNSFNPIFVGRFERTSSGATLKGHFRVHWLVIIFLCGFLGIVVFQLAQTLTQPEIRPGYVAGWRDHELEFELEFLLAALAVPLVGWLVGLYSRNAVLRAICARP